MIAIARSRRGVTAVAACLLVAAACGPTGDGETGAEPVAQDSVSAATSPPEPAWDSGPLERVIAGIVGRSDGVVGVAAIHLETGRRASVHGDDRFPMASVYKLPIAIALLERVDAGTVSLGDSVTVEPEEFVGGRAVLSREAGGRPITVTVGRLLELAVRESDNTASDALLRVAGGAKAVTARLRAMGIEGIDVSRSEAEIFAAPRSRPADSLDVRDTAAPEATVRLLVRLHEGTGLSPESRALLLRHLGDATFGAARIGGLLPPGTPIVHKTGTMTGQTNDVGIVTLPDGTHVALAVYVTGSTRPMAEQERTIAEVASAVYDAFTRTTPAPPDPLR